MYDHPYSEVFMLLLWITPILMYYTFRKSPVKYKLPKCYMNFILVGIPIYLLGIIILSNFTREKYDYLWYFKKYMPITIITSYIISVLLTFIICKMEFKLPNNELEVVTKPSNTKVLIKNNKVLGFISIILLGISIWYSNIFFVGSLLACPVWGILFFLHFNPKFKEFTIANTWFLLTLCFSLFLLSSTASVNKDIILPLGCIWSFASLTSIFLYNSYLVTGKKYLSTKYSYLFMLLFLLPFFLTNPLISLYPKLFLWRIMCDQWNFFYKIPLHVKFILIIIAAIFSYYWFLKLKKNILIKKPEPPFKLDNKLLPECSFSN